MIKGRLQQLCALVVLLVPVVALAAAQQQQDAALAVVLYKDKVMLCCRCGSPGSAAPGYT